MNSLKNERGFLLLNVIFLTLITSVAAMILMNAATRARNPQVMLRLTAIHLTNEQFAALESLAATGDMLSGRKNFQGNDEDLTNYNLGKENPIKFEVHSEIPTVTNLNEPCPLDIKVTVKIVGDENFKFEAERTILFVPK